MTENTTNLNPEEEKPIETPENSVEKVDDSVSEPPTESSLEEINDDSDLFPITELESPTETIIEPPKAPWIPSFFGEGNKYFVIQLVNTLLRLITLNFYYPWAKAAKLRYLYEQTEFAGSRFSFHGNGKEMFIGYLKAFAIFGVLLGAYYYSIFQNHPILAFFILYLGGILVYPLAIHGTIKYRMSRTSWRGIFFGYHGELGEIFAKIFIGGLLSVLSLGIYWSWVDVDVRRYVTQNLRFGDVEFDFVGKASDLFLIKLKYVAFFTIGYFLIIIIILVFVAMGFGLGALMKGGSGSLEGLEGFGVMMFVTIGVMYLLIIAVLGVIGLMRQREIFQFYADNTKIWQDEKWHSVKLNMTFGELFRLSLGNMLLLIVTLGIAFPYVEIRNLHFIMPRLAIEGTFNPDVLSQTEDDYRDATGEDMADWLDIDLV